MGVHRVFRAALVLASTISLVVTTSTGMSNANGSVTGPCSGGPAAGGDWPSYGHDLSNSRTQPAETTLGPLQALRLAPAWKFSTAAQGDLGSINTTPIEWAGCVYADTSTGNIYALDAASGALVWHRTLSVPNPNDSGGALVGAPAIDGNRIIFLVDETSGPYAVALDRRTGTTLWTSAAFTTFPGSYTNASAVVYNGMLLAGYSPPEDDPHGQGGFVLLDDTTGALLVQTSTISAADQALGYAGGGIWSTAAVDPSTGYAFVGAGNPYSKTLEDPHTNAILKVDLNRADATFGKIVGAYKGNVDTYLQTLHALATSPVCTPTVNNTLCGQLDLDFGATPNLFHDSSGTLLVGDLQKSGVYHAAHASDMSRDWTELMGIPCALCNLASTAADGRSVYGAASAEGVMQAANETTGHPRWLSLVADGVHYQSTSEADGVVYTVDGLGFLDAWCAADGVPILKRPMALDTGQTFTMGLSSAGVAIADHTVFAIANTGLQATVSALDPTPPSVPYEAGAWVIAYRPH